MFVPFLAMNRPTVDVEMDMVVLDLDVREVSRIARFHCRTPDSESLLQCGTARGGNAIPQLDPRCSHREKGARVNNLGLKVTDDLEASLLRHAWSIGRNGRRRRRGLQGRGTRRRSRGWILRRS